MKTLAHTLSEVKKLTSQIAQVRKSLTEDLFEKESKGIFSQAEKLEEKHGEEPVDQGTGEP